VIEELRPATLTEAAGRLGLDPFELVRRQVAIGDFGPSWLYDEARLRALADGEVEATWLLPSALPPTPVGRARAALAALLDQGAVAPRSCRADNLWRGLPPGDEALFRRVIDSLEKDGLLETNVSGDRLLVAVAAGAADKVRAIATGASDSPGFRAALVG
jgi:hypothetical protein